MDERELSSASDVFGKVIVQESIVPIIAWFHDNNLTPTTYHNDVMLIKRNEDSYLMRLLITMQPEAGGDIVNVMFLGSIYTTKKKINGIFFSVDIGLIEDFSVPRGVYLHKDLNVFQKNETHVLPNEGDRPDISTVNPLQSLLNQEIEAGKQSKIITLLNKLGISRSFLVTPRGSKTILTVGMSNDYQTKTYFRASTPFTAGLKTLNFEMLMPDYKPLTRAMETLARLRSISKDASVPYDVDSGILGYYESQDEKEKKYLDMIRYSLPLHLALCLDRASEFPSSLDTFDGYSLPSDSERETFLVKLNEKESR
ncbi:MAG: hypothetical protein RTU63_11810 [Candidatus Thorarchaeota archaeon]